MSELYGRIVTNEIKMKDTGVDGLMSGKAKAAQSSGWMDNIMNLIPGRKQQANNEPSEENIKKTHEYLRCVFWSKFHLDSPNPSTGA